MAEKFEQLRAFVQKRGRAPKTTDPVSTWAHRQRADHQQEAAEQPAWQWTKP